MDYSAAAVALRQEVLPPACMNLAGPEALDRTLWDTHIVHSIPGRVRLRVPAFWAAPDLAGSLEALLRTQSGIAVAAANSWCHSVTVTYDSSHWTADTICAFVQQLGFEEIEQYSPVRSPQDESSRHWAAGWIEPCICWKVAGYFTLVLGIILFALPMVPGGTPLLFLSTVCFSKAAALKLEQVMAI